MDNKENTRAFLNRLVMAAIFIIIWARRTLYRFSKSQEKGQQRSDNNKNQ